MQIRPNISMAICTAGASRIAPVRQENPPSTIVGLRPRCFDVKLPMKAPTMPARNSTLTKSRMSGSPYLQNVLTVSWWIDTCFQQRKIKMRHWKMLGVRKCTVPTEGCYWKARITLAEPSGLAGSL
eukprot:GHUV01034180.1.p1 GENE.GHUV01034180.1~~GHUV01034180.1.p1  ORF type:complete len:126 (-),score=11.44 GHUV01034180.1:612-989(-)